MAENYNTNSKDFRRNIRSIGEVHKYGGGFYERIINEKKRFLECVIDAYEGSEHYGKNGCKIPNMTRIWNLPFNSGGFLYGSSLGHVHPKRDFHTQEIYEFFGHGGMMIASGKEAKLYICEEGDKVAVPSDCMMTILNFSANELLTLDLANPAENESSKDILLKDRRGPMIALYHTGMQNEMEYCSLFSCSSFLSHKFMRMIRLPTKGIVKMRLNKEYDIFKDVGNEEIELKVGDDESDLLNEIFIRRNELRKYNISVIEAEAGVECIGRDERHYRICERLEREAVSSSRLVPRILGMEE